MQETFFREEEIDGVKYRITYYSDAEDNFNLRGRIGVLNTNTNEMLVIPNSKKGAYFIAKTAMSVVERFINFE